MKRIFNKFLITISLAALLVVFAVLCIQSKHALALEHGAYNKKDILNVAVYVMLQLINEEREYNHMPALKLDETMQKAADHRVSELLINFSHERPDGRNFSTIFAEFNLAPREGAENIAWKNIELDVLAFHNAFMGSPVHRVNILNPKYSIIGIGFRIEDDKYYVVELFADKS